MMGFDEKSDVQMGDFEKLYLLSFQVKSDVIPGKSMGKGQTQEKKSAVR